MNLTYRNVVIALVLTLCAQPAMAGDPGDTAYVEQMEQWRQARHERLADPDGWMTLVGMEWLSQGENRVGSAEDSDARIPGGPENWGTIYLAGDELRFVPVAGNDVTVDGEQAVEAKLVADSQGKPTVVRSGDLSFYVIHRESYALRVKDRKAPNLLAFTHMPAYDIDTDWRIEGQVVSAEEGATIEVANVLGQINEVPLYGTFEFERDGEPFSLLALGTTESSSLWFIFADKTSGRETYGAGRFLYSDGMPLEGRVVVDFNKAYNPPCAYNDYSTCTLPPPQNRLKVAVRAGEKKYHE
jgi:uncharacterized protein (DUF1684 family)